MHFNPGGREEGGGAQGQWKPAGGSSASEGPSSRRDSALCCFHKDLICVLMGLSLLYKSPKVLFYFFKKMKVADCVCCFLGAGRGQGRAEGRGEVGVLGLSNSAFPFGRPLPGPAGWASAPVVKGVLLAGFGENSCSLHYWTPFPGREDGECGVQPCHSTQPTPAGTCTPEL